MNNDTALVLLLADRQREIEALRAENADLHQALRSVTAAAQPSEQQENDSA